MKWDRSRFAAAPESELESLHYQDENRYAHMFVGVRDLVSIRAEGDRKYLIIDGLFGNEAKKL